MECTGGDKQDVIGFNHAVLGRDGGTLYQRQQITLDALTGDFATAGLAAALGDFIDLIQEYDAVLLDRVNRAGFDFFLVDQLARFFIA